MTLSPEVRARLNARFDARLPGYLEALERARLTLETDVDAGWDDVLRLAHQLSGTAASFGRPRLTEIAQEVHRDGPDGLASLDALVDEVRHAISSPRADDPSPET